MSEEETDEAPGWDAITDACTAIYGDQEPSHWGTIIPAMLGGDDPLDGLSAYDAGDHWHYVTYGYSDLHFKEGDDPDWSGFGIEMTFRLTKTEDEPPVWPCNLLQNLARYVFQTGNTFAPGHSMNANGPIAADRDTQLTCMVFAEDPQLGSIETPHGRVDFIQLVGITEAEKAMAASWNGDGLVGLLRKDSELLVTDLARPDASEREEWVATANEGRAREGSSMGTSFASHLTVAVKGLLKKRATVELSANIIDQLKLVLPGRLPFGNPYGIRGPDTWVGFVPGDEDGWARREGGLEVTLTDASMRAMLDGLEVRRGTYPVPGIPTLTLEVVPTEIKDRDGTVVEVIG